MIVATTGWLRADAVVSLPIGLLILPRTWSLLRDTVNVLTHLPVLTAHVVVDDSCFHDGHAPRILDHLQEQLAGRFDVEHCISSSNSRGTPTTSTTRTPDPRRQHAYRARSVTLVH